MDSRKVKRIAKLVGYAAFWYLFLYGGCWLVVRLSRVFIYQGMK